jgi:hypothetical protein
VAAAMAAESSRGSDAVRSMRYMLLVLLL